MRTCRISINSRAPIRRRLGGDPRESQKKLWLRRGLPTISPGIGNHLGLCIYSGLLGCFPDPEEEGHERLHSKWENTPLQLDLKPEVPQSWYSKSYRCFVNQCFVHQRFVHQYFVHQCFVNIPTQSALLAAVDLRLLRYCAEVCGLEAENEVRSRLHPPAQSKGPKYRHEGTGYLHLASNSTCKPIMT